MNPGACNCAECEFQRFMFASHFGGGRGFPFGFSAGGGGFFFSGGFAFYEESDSEDDWDRRWDEYHEEDLEAKNEEAAEILGVDVDANAADIKRVYRRKVLLYHPDKYRPDNPEGLTAKECEDKFKALQNAYDHLMSNFDD